jgi:hypothetical protein
MPTGVGGGMRDIQMRPDGLMSCRQQTLDCLQRGRFHQIDHYRRRQHVHAPAADVRRRVFFADDDFDRTGEPGLQCIHIGGSSIQRLQKRERPSIDDRRTRVR